MKEERNENRKKYRSNLKTKRGTYGKKVKTKIHKKNFSINKGNKQVIFSEKCEFLAIL